MRTRDARAVLPASVSLELAPASGRAGRRDRGGCCLGDAALLGRAIDDRLAEPVRAPLLPGFSEAKLAAMETGALGCSISGSGPTAFAVRKTRRTAERIATAMMAAYHAPGTVEHGTSDLSRPSRPPGIHLMTLFHTPRPPSWQVCIACGEEKVETDPAIRCECGGLLEIRHSPPAANGSLAELFRARVSRPRDRTLRASGAITS
jgi:hypothetical protein